MAILINEPQSAPKPPTPDFLLGWSLLLVMGWIFTVIGLLNIALIWVPLQFGVPEYEFSSVAASLDSLPLPTMGLVFALAASRAQGRRKSALLATVLTCLLAALIVGAAVLYWLDVPLALKAVTDRLPRLGIKKSMTKVSAQAVLYPIGLVVFAWMGSRKQRS